MVLVGAFGAHACAAPPRRELVLRALVRELAVADADNVASRSADLRLAATRFATAPSAAELRALRAAWHRSALAWKRASAFRWGPLVDSGALNRAHYWPVRPAALDSALDGGRPLNSEFVEELGADVKGIYALEYWLFAATGAERGRPPLEAPASARARELVRLYAEDIDVRASRVRQTLEKGARRLSESLAERENDAFGRIWTMLLDNIEALLIARFKLALWLASLDKLRTSDVEGGPSRASHELAVALLLATQRLYRGPAGCGFADLIRSAAPRVHQHVESVFGRSVSLMRSLPPIDDAARSFRTQLEATVAALKELETAFRNEVPTALGAPLSFSSIDAD